MINEISQIIGKIIIFGGGSAACAYGIFIFLGKKWIEDKFSRSLEIHRNDLMKDFAEHKVELDTFLNKKKTIHDVQIKVFPDAYRIFHTAKICFEDLIYPFISYPLDFNHNTDDKIRSYLEKHKFNDDEINNILTSSNKNTTYTEMLKKVKLRESFNSYFQFHEYVGESEIFLTDNLNSKFKEFDKIVSEEINRRLNGENPVSFRELRNNVNTLQKEIVREIKGHLANDRNRLMG